MEEKWNHVSSPVEAIDRILLHAVNLGASDIHCDPEVDRIVIRMRIDGILEHITFLSKNFHEEMIARLKILSGARTDIRNLPQDGRWKTDIGLPYNIRISFMPTYHGENAVMRLLPIERSKGFSFIDLGFNADHVRSIQNAIAQTTGLILVTGPTGSGKTTTLHACLAHKAQEKISIITLEDPIEYEIPGIRQVYVRHTHGMTFANGLRASLRQDPDVIMVGEIRDHETARVAVHTALTGHLVFSTLHTNSALETIPRLIDMGVDTYLLASTLRLVIGQRLVRVICKSCNREGCEICRGTGLTDRMVIAEMCEVDTVIRKLILSKAPLSDYSQHLSARGFCSMHDDGAEKIEWGMTTPEEVRRVLSE